MVGDLVIPKNPEAEKAIFSIILSEPERLVEVIDGLEVADFYDMCNQEIWKAIKSLYLQGTGIDIVSIKTELQKQNIDYKPTLIQISSCYENQVVGGNLDSFIKEVKNKAVLREIIRMASNYQQSASLDEAEANDLLGGIDKEVITLSEKIHDGRGNDSQSIIRELREDIARGKESNWRGYETGFRWLDEQTGGLMPTHCWVIGGYTGQGKSFFLLQILLHVLERGGKVILFSTEMDRKMNMLRALGNLAGIGTLRMLKGNLDEEEHHRIEEAANILEAYKDSFLIYDNVYSVEEIRLKAKKQKIQKGLDVVAVDFIQNLRGPENIYERMSNAAISLQQIAQELNLTMMIASQVTQEGAGWVNKEVIEYKGAGEIAAIADVAIWLQRVKEDKSARTVILRKVRHGVPGKFQVRISFPSGKVIDMMGEEVEANGT